MKKTVFTFLSAASAALLFAATPAAGQGASLPLNISTRLEVGIGDNVLIGGFIIDGTDPKEVVVRAIGPSLSGSNVTDALQDPYLQLRNLSGEVVAINDNWMDNSSSEQSVLTSNGLAPTDPAESAIVATLDPGAYTATVFGVNDTTGIGLVEVYDLDNLGTDSKLANISTRGAVGHFPGGEDTDKTIMIGGFILAGGGPSTVVVRGVSAQGENLLPLEDPILDLHNGDGDLIDSNDNWMDHPNMQMVIDSGLDPSIPEESALYKVLSAGAYTAILRGVEGSLFGSFGIGLVEVYNLD